MSLASQLTTDDYRGILAVLEVVGRAPSLDAFGESLVAALEEHLGYRMSAFFVSGPLGEKLRPLAPASRGMPPGHVEGWGSFWGEHDPLNSPAAFAAQRRRGVVDIEQLHAALDSMQRRYVTEFLRPGGIDAQLAFHVDTGLRQQGYGSLAAGRGGALGPVDHARAAALRPHLANLLRRHLPAPDAAGEPLSTREAEIAALVAQGRSNREIAATLSISEATVKQHVSRVLRKLRVGNRTQLSVVWRDRARPDSGTA